MDELLQLYALGRAVFAVGETVTETGEIFSATPPKESFERE